MREAHCSPIWPSSLRRRNDGGVHSDQKRYSLRLLQGILPLAAFVNGKIDWRQDVFPFTVASHLGVAN